jgi:hypothetical protein
MPAIRGLSLLVSKTLQSDTGKCHAPFITRTTFDKSRRSSGEAQSHRTEAAGTFEKRIELNKGLDKMAVICI